MNKFKNGDKVKCIFMTGSSNKKFKGQTATVIGYVGPDVRVKWDKNGTIDYYYEDRFELANINWKKLIEGETKNGKI